MALVSQLLVGIAQKVRPCPSATLRYAYLRAARRFCTETRWYQLPYELTLVAGQRTYVITPPTRSGFATPQLEVIDLAWYGHWLNSSLTGQLSWARLLKGDPSRWNPNMANQTPTRVAYYPEGEVQFDPTPDQAYPVNLQVAYQPTADATDIPDELLVKWTYGIEAGALAYLYGLAGEPWADALKEKQASDAAQAAINNAKAIVAAAYQSGSRRANPRPFVARGWLR